MNETGPIDEFDRELDHLLSGAAPDGRPHNATVQSALETAGLLNAADFTAEVRPRRDIRARWQQQTGRPPRPALRWVWAGLAVALLAVLVNFRQPVMASIGRLFGFAYLPQAGFVDLDAARVLQNPVSQVHEGRSLTVTGSLATARDTQLWLEFSDEARAIDGAWLETPDGGRIELLNWAWQSNQPGERGVTALFPALPPEINQVTLALPEGWRIPLTWVPGGDSALTPANVTAPYPTTAPDEDPVEIAVTAPCFNTLEIAFCVQAAARTTDELQVLVEAAPGGAYTPGSPFSLSPFESSGETAGITLSDASGANYPLDPDYIRMDGDAARLASTLRFPGAQALTGQLTLQIPAVLASIPLEDELVIDLGSNPQPGQTWDIDQTVDVAGLPLHFGRATLDGDGVSSLRLTVSSDPLDDSAMLRPYALEVGRPEGIADQYGAGSGPDGLFVHVELLQPSGLVSGELRIPLLSAALKARGTFALTFDAPAEGVAASPEPQVIEGGDFEPLPVGEPLSMDAFQYSGRALQPGDLLGVALEDDHSLLYAASPAADFSPELLAVLPGQVLAVYAHPDRQGIDYLTGEYDAASFNTRYHQLYTLRFAEGTPRLLVGDFERSAFNFAWSFDGRYLAYLTTSDRPGTDYQRYVRIIDLTCRERGACDAFAADTGTQDIYELAWAPSDYRMALNGTPAEQAYGSNDIFLLSLDSQTNTTVLTNLTQSPEIDDQPPAAWTSDGTALLFACSAGITATNEYSLCRSDLNPGTDEIVVPLLPWNMHFPRLAADRWIIDGIQVMSNGVYSLRSFDLQSGQSAALLEWPASGKYPVETAVSPDGKRLAAIINDLGGLLVIDVEGGANRLALPAETGTLLWAGWVQ
jgi:hypothetical protein